MSTPKHVLQKITSQQHTIERLTRTIATLDMQRAKAQMDCENMIDDIRAILNAEHTDILLFRKELRNIINKQRGNELES